MVAELPNADHADLGRLAGSFATVSVAHQIVSLMGYWLGMRTTAR
jgi:hypothetical protein